MSSINKQRHHQIYKIGMPDSIFNKKVTGQGLCSSKNSLGCPSADIGLHRLLYSRHYFYTTMYLV